MGCRNVSCRARLAALWELDAYRLCKASSAAPGDELSEGLQGVSGAAGPQLGS